MRVFVAYVCPDGLDLGEYAHLNQCHSDSKPTRLYTNSFQVLLSFFVWMFSSLECQQCVENPSPQNHHPKRARVRTLR